MKFPHLNLVAIVKFMSFDAFTLVIGAVERGEVSHLKGCARATEFCVPTRNCHIVKENV
jgi:hypothetical protein